MPIESISIGDPRVEFAPASFRRPKKQGGFTTWFYPYKIRIRGLDARWRRVKSEDYGQGHVTFVSVGLTHIVLTWEKETGNPEPAVR